MHKYPNALGSVALILGLIGFCPVVADAQIFKSSGETAKETPKDNSQEKNKPAPTQKKKASAAKAAQPKATKPRPAQPKATKPRPAQPKATKQQPVKQKPVQPKPEETAPVDQTATESGTEKAAARDDASNDDSADAACATLSECVAAIQATLDGMSTEEELRKLDALTKRAEALLAGDGAAAKGEGVAVVAAAEKPEDAAAVATGKTDAVSGGMTPEEVAALQARLEKVESELANVASKADENEQKIAAREPVKGFKIHGPGDSVFTISGLLQARMEMDQNGAPSGEDWSYGLYIRRMRLMFYGQLTKWLNFFIETEQANFGKNGDWGGRMFIQDAYVEFNPHKAFQLDVGMMLPALSRHANQSATSLLGMDYHGALVKYPTGSTMVWRDMGVMVRGLVLSDRLDYRFAVWSGVHGSGADPRNPKDLPRLSGRLTANVFDAEGGGGVGGMFFDGLYIKQSGKHVVSTKRVLSFGVSFDWQPDLNVQYAVRDPNADPETPDTPIAYSDYIAVAGDVFWDLPFGEDKILSANGQMDFYYFNHGDRRTDTGNWYYNTAGNGLNYTGWGMFGEYGIRYSKFQALFAMDVYDSTKADGKTGDYLNFAGGLNYYMLAHAATLKLQIGADKVADNDWKTSMKLQLQLVF